MEVITEQKASFGGQPCLVAILTFLSFRIPSCSLPILVCNFLSSSSRTSSFRNPRLITPGSRLYIVLGTLLPKELYSSWLRCVGKRASMLLVSCTT